MNTFSNLDPTLFSCLRYTGSSSKVRCFFSRSKNFRILAWRFIAVSQ